MTEPGCMLPQRTVCAAALGLPGEASWLLHGVLPPSPRIAVIGSRAAQRAALACVPAIVRAAGACGHALVSGGARGIDAAAHRAALAAGVPQLAILPCGPDAPYPPEHAGLFAEIAAAPRSGVLYTRPVGASNSRGIFASRNLMVVAAAAAVVVAQAQPRSGSWGTGRLALRRGRPTAALACGAGCADLIAAGALGLASEPASIEAAVLAWLRAPATPASAVVWPAELRWLADALRSAGARGLGLDDLEQDGADACAALLSAELLGLVVESPPGRYHLRR